MHSTESRALSRTMGGVQVWTVILLLAVVCMAALLYFQAQEHLFYDKPPSVWPQLGAAPVQQPVVSVPSLTEGGAAPVQPAVHESGAELPAGGDATTPSIEAPASGSTSAAESPEKAIEAEPAKAKAAPAPAQEASVEEDEEKKEKISE